MSYKGVTWQKYILSLGLGLLIIFAISNNSFAKDDSSEEFNPSETIMHHIADSHEWHLFSIGETHVSIPLPIILYTPNGLDIFMSTALHHVESTTTAEIHGETMAVKELTHGGNTYYIDSHEHFHLKGGGTLYDFSITKNVASMFVSVVLLFAVFLNVAAGYKKNKGKAPKGIQSFFEPIIIFVRDDIAKANINEKNYERFTPYLLTVFFFIWFNNMLGLMPGGANLTGNIAVTLVLAILTFVITQINGTGTYWGHIFWTPGVPWWLKTVLPIMPIVEFIGIFTKPFSLMVRLFANITAGHIIILSLFSLIFIFQSYAVGVVSVAFATFMNFLELFVALLQAYVFTLLTAMYFGGAVEEHHHEEHGHEEPDMI